MNKQKSSENKHFRTKTLRSLFIIILTFLMTFTTVAPAIPAQAASGNMQITPIDFGDAGVWGDCTMLSSGGKNLLMDTYIRDTYDTLLNYLDDHHFYTFDIYLSHYHYDHMDQISTIIDDSRFNVGTVYLPDPAYVKKGAQYTSYCKDFLNGYNDIVNTAKENGCRIVYLKKGSTFTVGNATVKVLWGCSYTSNSYDASYINNNSLVTKVTSGTTSYLTCGDIESEVENQLVKSGIDLSADIFKFNHHGGNSSNTAAFVKKVNPSFAFYNWLGDSPTSFGGGWVQTPIDNLKNTCNIYSTRYNGMLTFTVKAGHISVAGERNMRTVNASIKNSAGNIVNTVTYQFNDALDYHITAKMKSTAATVTAANSTTALPTRYAYTAKFIETSGGVKYRNKDGSYSKNKFQEIDGDIYYFDANGYRLTSWKRINGKMYYFTADGKMLLRWKRINGRKYYFDPEDGHMHTGWEWVEEKKAWYYLSPTLGCLLEGWQTIDGKKYYLTPTDFYAKTGWQTIDGKKYYFDLQNAYMYTGWRTIGGKQYYFGTDGVMVTGTRAIDGKTYVFNTSGVLTSGNAPAASSSTTTSTPTETAASGNKTGWVKVGTGYKYQSGTSYVTNRFMKIDGSTYYFGPDGYRMTSWKLIGGKFYYLTPTDFYAKTGWQTINGRKYYFDPQKAYAYSGWQTINGKKYYFDTTNVYMYTSWKRIAGKMYYFGTDGVMTTGTRVINGRTYKFDSNGVLLTTTGTTASTASTTTTTKTSSTTSSATSASAAATGNKTGWVQVGTGYKYQKGTSYVTNQMMKIGSYTYYFAADGYRQTGWKRIAGQMYYFDTNGRMLLRWKRINGRKYLFDPVDGHMHTGWEWVEENNAWYYLNPHMLTGWQTIDGKKYYFDPYGAMVTGKQTIDGKSYTFDSNGVLKSGTATASTTATSSKISWNSTPYITSAVTSTWDKGTDDDMSFDVTTKRNTAFVNTMLAYATYFVDKIDYASSVTNNDPTGLRFLRLKSGGKTDCSWFVYHVLYKFGLAGEDFIHSYQWGNDPSTYPGGVNIGTDVSKASPGDIICTGKGTASSNSHVMIYLGGGQVVECAAGYGVIISDAPDTARQIVHFSCLPTNPSAPYVEASKGSWVASGSNYKYKVGSSYLTNCFQNIDGDIYYFDANGNRLTGWKKINGKMYYFTSAGKMYLRWKRINGNKYYFDPISGYMHTGWEWVSENNAWYYLDPDKGYLVSGWQTIDGKKYYFNSDNKMVTGKQTIDGNTYTFGSDGVLQ